jgi:hypothetical protein
MEKQKSNQSLGFGKNLDSNLTPNLKLKVSKRKVGVLIKLFEMIVSPYPIFVAWKSN